MNRMEDEDLRIWHLIGGKKGFVAVYHILMLIKMLLFNYSLILLTIEEPKESTFRWDILIVSIRSWLYFIFCHMMANENWEYMSPLLIGWRYLYSVDVIPCFSISLLVNSF